jgi:FkbM family methyltransferase
MVFDKKLLGPQSIVADVGANLGFYSLWFAGRVNQVHAFEPAPEARAMLMENLAVNGTRNVSIVASACGDRQGAIDFFVADHHHRSSFDESWAGDRATKISIPVTSLDQYFADLGNNWPDFIKMDIEGGGTSALPGAARCLREKRPLLLIESHTPQEDGAISDVLRTYDYAAYRFETKAWVQNRETTHPDPLGVWGTMFLCPSEKKHHFMHK